MKIIEHIDEMRVFVKPLKFKKTIGLVPTMGALHQGHLNLVEQAQEKSQVVIASIFVNPAQFNKKEDLAFYPRTLEADLAKLEETGCDVVFIPQAEEMYPNGEHLKMALGKIGQFMEGEFRPGHFNGVALVIAKLFNICLPDYAYFGQKDIQQYYVIEKLTQDLSFPVSIEQVPTAREKNGLAMSSRNLRLSQEQREQASLIHQALRAAQKILLAEKSIALAKDQVQKMFASQKIIHLEYFEVAYADEFLPLEVLRLEKPVVLCLAAEIGGVRLIDNLPLK